MPVSVCGSLIRAVNGVSFVFRRFFVAPAAFLILLLTHSADLGAQLAGSEVASAEPNRSEQARCRVCHGGFFAAADSGPHSVLSDEEWAARLGVGFACTACHGDASEHIAAGGQGPVLAFRDEEVIIR